MPKIRAAEHFHGDVAVQGGLPGFIDNSHSSFAKYFDDLQTRKLRPVAA
jgi:hypothetical protein